MSNNQFPWAELEALNSKQEAWDCTPAPCDGCIYAHRCAVQEIACEDFYNFVKLEDDKPLVKVRRPSKKYYDRIYRMAVNERPESIINGEGSGGDTESIDRDYSAFGSEW